LNDDELLRYSRQIMLPEIDIDGQQKLAQARVLIIGLGGLGSPVAMYLAAAGVGHLVLVDFDQVELSNLQRQIVHDSHKIGQPKVSSAAETLARLNPLVQIETIARTLDEKELQDQARIADVVVDATDNLSTRFAISDACVRTATPLVSGAAIRLEGQVLVYHPQQIDAPCYRCLYRGPMEIDESCAQNGVIPPLLGIIGSIQALETMKLIVGFGESLQGLLLLDARTLEWQPVTVKRHPDCVQAGHCVRLPRTG